MPEDCHRLDSDRPRPGHQLGEALPHQLGSMGVRREDEMYPGARQQRHDLGCGVALTGGKAPPCQKAADVNDDGTLDISDGVALLSHLFLGGKEPAAPFPYCALGDLSAPDNLICWKHRCGTMVPW